MNFNEAIAYYRDGHFIHRKQWEKRGCKYSFEINDECPENDTISMEDVLSSDWVVGKKNHGRMLLVDAIKKIKSGPFTAHRADNTEIVIADYSLSKGNPDIDYFRSRGFIYDEMIDNCWVVTGPYFLNENNDICLGCENNWVISGF